MNRKRSGHKRTRSTPRPKFSENTVGPSSNRVRVGEKVSNSTRTPRSVFDWLAFAGVAALVTFAVFQPADSTDVEQGNALWLFPIALVAWTCAEIASRQRTRSAAVRDDWRLRLSLGLVFVWVVVAAWTVAGVGNYRAALNEVWWWGTGVLVFLAARECFRSQRRGHAIAMLVLALAASQATYALHQQWISLPADRLAFEQDPEGVLAISGIDAPEGSPLRKLFRDRLYGGGPTGSYALTNTLAGMLLLGVVLGASGLVDGTRRGGSIQRFGLAHGALFIMTGLCAVAIYYTSSRGAFAAIGMAVAIIFVGNQRWIRNRIATRRRWAAGLFGSALTASLVAVVAFATLPSLWRLLPRTLVFRAQYWSSTWNLVMDHPWFGAGPGNFQQSYLEYRFDEASESIADPHNWIVETLAIGGFPLLLFCLLAMLVVLIGSRDGDRVTSDELEERRAALCRRVPRGALLVGSIGAFCLLFANWLLFPSIDPLPLLLSGLVMAGGLWWLQVDPWLANHSPDQRRDASLGIYAAVIAMMVHWLVAGGWTVPGLAIPWLILAGALTPARVSNDGEISGAETSPERSQPANSQPSENDDIPWFHPLGLAMFVLALGLAWWWTAWQPVSTARALAGEGDRELRRGQFAAASQAYLQATAADPHNPDFVLRLSDIRCREVLTRGDGAAAREAWNEAVAESSSRNPSSPIVAAELGAQAIWLYQGFGKWDDLQRAAEAYEKAVGLAPSEERYVAQLALLKRALGDDAQAEELWERASYLAEAGGHAERDLSVVQAWFPQEIPEVPQQFGPQRESAQLIWDREESPSLPGPSLD